MDKTLITQDRKEKIRNLDLGGGLVSGDGGLEIEELEKQAQPKGGRTHCGRPHEACSSKLVVRNKKKTNAHSHHIFPPYALEHFVF